MTRGHDPEEGQVAPALGEGRAGQDQGVQGPVGQDLGGQGPRMPRRKANKGTKVHQAAQAMRIRQLKEIRNTPKL